jgi:hypothetical protein
MLLPTATSTSKVLRGLPRSWRENPPIKAYEMPPVWKIPVMWSAAKIRWLSSVW